MEAEDDDDKEEEAEEEEEEEEESDSGKPTNAAFDNEEEEKDESDKDEEGAGLVIAFELASCATNGAGGLLLWRPLEAGAVATVVVVVDPAPLCPDKLAFRVL